MFENIKKSCKSYFINLRIRRPEGLNESPPLPIMSNRYVQNKGFSKTQKKFVPKTQREVHANSPSLSTSLRHSAASSSSTPRALSAENTDSVSCRGEGGSFFNYLPQDEAVASGLGSQEGGLDPMESQSVVDLANKELSRLLKLSPREFWKQGVFVLRCSNFSLRI